MTPGWTGHSGPVQKTVKTHQKEKILLNSIASMNSKARVTDIYHDLDRIEVYSACQRTFAHSQQVWNDETKSSAGAVTVVKKCEFGQLQPICTDRLELTDESWTSNAVGEDVTQSFTWGTLVYIWKVPETRQQSGPDATETGQDLLVILESHCT